MLSVLQIKVAVAADRDCIRAYQPQISSTNYNTLALNVKTREPDNLLFYLGSSAGVSDGMQRAWGCMHLHRVRFCSEERKVESP